VKKGKFKDFLRCINTKPGKRIVMVALLGGPIAGTAYVIALQMAGSIIVPVTALCPAFSAILGKIIYKQEINKRMAFGIFICISASFLIGSTGITGGVSKNVILGLLIALIAAFGWGLEGCLAGYASAMVDPEIGICIRQLTSGLVNLFIVLPILGIMAGGVGISTDLAIQAFTSGSAMIWFVVSGLATFVTFMSWYKGNSMCGAGLGGACNGTFSFFGPFFCYIILGVVAGMDGWLLPPIAWVGAVIMIFGILVITMNPLDLIIKQEEKEIELA
jgi:drug/metabolite transporter (DMT)-like permease